MVKGYKGLWDRFTKFLIREGDGEENCIYRNYKIIFKILHTKRGQV
jgi:hypothetical protein